jgi:hypothetical protein
VLVIALVMGCKGTSREPPAASGSTVHAVADASGPDAAPRCDPSRVAVEFPTGLATDRACALFGSWLLLDGVRPYYALEIEPGRVRFQGNVYDRRVAISPCEIHLLRPLDGLLESVWFQYWVEPDGPVFTRDAIGERFGNQVIACYAQDYIGDPSTGECRRSFWVDGYDRWERDMVPCRFAGPDKRLMIRSQRDDPFELRSDGARLIGTHRGAFPHEMRAIRVPTHQAALDAIARSDKAPLGPFAIAAGGKPGDLTTVLGAWATLHEQPTLQPKVELRGLAIACAATKYDRRVSEIAVVASTAHVELAVMCRYEGTCPKLARLAPVVIQGTLAIDQRESVLGVYECKHRLEE